MILKLIIAVLFIFKLDAALSEEKIAQLAQQAEQFMQRQGAQYPAFEHPVQHPEQINAHFPDGKVLIFGYGSLLNHNSAARTLSEDAMQTYDPVLAFGLQRVFDYKVVNPVNWGPKQRPSDMGMLNVYRTGNMADVVNGVTYEVDAQDLANLVRREQGYDLIPIPFVRWSDVEGHPQFAIAYTFAASAEPRDGRVFVNKCINPVPKYAEASKEGAATNGKAFEDFWVKTTYLADRKTPFQQWEEHPEIDLSINCGKQ